MGSTFSTGYFPESDYERKHRLAALKNIQNFASTLLQLCDRLEAEESEGPETTAEVKREKE
jgi:hypothetical protein